MEIKLKKVSFGKTLRNLNLNLSKNNINVFMGHKEKADIIKIIGLLELPSSGSISFDNKEITNKDDISLNLSSNIGLVCSENQFFLNSVRAEIEFVLKNYNYKLYNIDKRVSDSLKIVGLNDSYLDLNPSILSCSEQKKLSLAIALSYNPKILILDNISNGLDSKNKLELVKLIKMMKYRYKKTIIISSNDSDFVHLLADHIYIINKGKIVSDGDKYTIFSDYDNLSKYNLKMPEIMYFYHLVKNKKKIKLSPRDNINDLIKDIYQSVK